VGVAAQYCGVLGKIANGQVAVTLQYVDPYHAWPVGGQLYLPEAWCEDQARRKRAGIPKEVSFQTKPELALRLIDQAVADGVSFGIVVSDSSYGDNPTFLVGLEERRLHHLVAVHCDFGVRLPEEIVSAAKQPLPAKRKSGRPRKHPHPVQLAPIRRADAVLASQAEETWQTITWRLGSDGPLSKRFLALRVHRAIGDWTGPESWLLGERPLADKEGELKYYWSDLPAETPLARLVEVAHRRPGVERGYEDGKGFTGLDAYAARKWASFHRHLAIEHLVLSWLALQRPAIDKPVIVLEPQPVSSPGEPVFPLRTRAVPEHRPDPPADLPVPPGGVAALAGALGSDRPEPAPRPVSPDRLPDSLQRPISRTVKPQYQY
jgi:SRSO17 transposase